MSNSTIQPCRLCQLPRELQQSHTELPAGVYRRLRGTATKNPNPVLLTENVCVATSRQPMEPMLCKQCEELFSKNGEKWMLENCLQPNGAFPLRDTVNQGQQLTAGEVVARSTRHFDTGKLEYFAASIFWRASVSKRSYGHQDRPVHLGQKYEEHFRQFLLGRAGFPANAALVVAISSSASQWTNVAWTPTGERKGEFHMWQTVIPGIIFQLFVGNVLPPPVKALCLVRSTLKIIQVTDKVDRQMAKWVLNYIGRDEERRKMTAKPGHRN